MKTIPALLLTLVFAMSGCVSHPHSSNEINSAGINIDLASRCDQPIQNCDDSTLPYALDGLVIKGAGISDGRYGISIVGLDRSLVIRNVSIEGFKIGVWIALERECAQCTIALTNVTLENLEYGIRSHPSLPAPAVLILERLGVFNTITGVELVQTGASEPLSEINVSDSTIECLRDGIVAAVTYMDVQNLTVSGCQGSGIWSNRIERLEIRNSTVSHSKSGIALFRDSPGNIDVTIETSLFDSNSDLALQFARTDAELSRVIFQENGRDALGDDPRLLGGLVIMEGSNIRVRQSSFVGNLPYAVSEPFAGNQADARENWWGDSAGPRVKASTSPLLPAVGAGGGDVVDHEVEYYPYLDAPP